MAAVAIIEASSSHIGNGDSDVARAAAGDRGAFERLYRDHVTRVFSLCARMVADRERAEELTQDVFVRAWEKLHLFRGESSFSTWLHRLTVNLVLNARKSEGRQRTRFEENDEESGGMDARRYESYRRLRRLYDQLWEKRPAGERAARRS